MDDMKIIDKVKSKTSRKNRIEGQTFTTIGTILGAIALSGLVVNPVGILALTIGGIICGVKAGSNALKSSDE